MEGVRERRLGSIVVAAAAGVIVLAGVHAAADLAVLVALSILVAILLIPLQQALDRRGLPGGVALIACLAVYVVVVVVAGLAIAIGLADFLRDLPTYRSDLDAAIADVGAPVVDAAAIEAAVRSVVAGAVGALATIGYSVFIVAYLLLDAPGMSSRLRAAFGDASGVPARAAATADRLRTYVVARAILGAIAALLDTVLLIVLGVPDALLWGMLSFLLSFIPNIGFILALVPPTIVGLLVGGPLTALLVVVGYSVINIAIDYVVQPRYVGSEVNLSAVVVTVSLLFWAVVLGGSGALLAVPLTIVAMAVFDAFDDSRPLATMLGSRVGDVPDAGAGPASERPEDGDHDDRLGEGQQQER
jgi:predicted PurR-regulated permease PerM